MPKGTATSRRPGNKSAFVLLCFGSLPLSNLRLPEFAVLDEYFPLSEPLAALDAESETEQPLPEPVPTKAMPATGLREESSGLRPGQAYLIYNSQDILGALPEDYEKLLRRASDWTGVDEHYISGVVERYERRLVRWWRTERGADKPEDSVGR